MNKVEISLRYLNGLVLEPSKQNNEIGASSLAAQMMQLGFIPTQELFSTIKSLSIDEIKDLYIDLVPVLRSFRGADVIYKPMYPNFPKQVMEMSTMKLWLNAMTHYWTAGIWAPDYKELPREYKLEFTKFDKIGLTTDTEFKSIFNKILSSNESITDTDKETIKWFMKNEDDLMYPKEIPFKENLCYVAGIFLQENKDITPFIKTATDLLRVITSLSGGDISLSSNTKFKSLPRETRRTLLAILEKVIREEDIERHRSKWNKIFHNLHVNEDKYTNIPKVQKIAKKVYNNEPIRTFNGKVEIAITNKNVESAIKLLKTRPGDYARRLDKLIRISDNKLETINSFIDVAQDVSTRVLLQVLGNLKTRNEDFPSKVIFPKGSMQKAVKIDTEIKAMPEEVRAHLKHGLEMSLIDRFVDLPSLGNVWIDPLLKDCPIPTQMRSTSKSFHTVARGTKLPIEGNMNTLRFFLYWVGEDIDISASLHDENFKLIETVAYYNLRSKKYESCHSGDIRHAPTGAAEFIDITMDKAVKSGLRYVVMNVNVFSGPTFAQHKKCYAGWMEREFPNSNAIFDPKTVKSKIDLTSESKFCMPVAFDLKDRKAIWIDLVSKERRHYWGNNVKSNQATIEQILEAIATNKNKVNLYELFELHAQARGVLVENKEDAKTIFSLYEGITPYHIMEINSEYIGG